MMRRSVSCAVCGRLALCVRDLFVFPSVERVCSVCWDRAVSGKYFFYRRGGVVVGRKFE